MSEFVHDHGIQEENKEQVKELVGTTEQEQDIRQKLIDRTIRSLKDKEEQTGTRPGVSLISAIGPNNEIGAEGGLPWDIPAEYEHFLKTTENKTIILGGRTFKEELHGKPLEGRRTIVISRSLPAPATGEYVVCRSPEEAMEQAVALENDEIFIGGGAGIYESYMPVVEKMYISQIQEGSATKTGTTFFPRIPENQFEIEEEEDRGQYKLNIYHRQKPLY